MIKSYCHSAFLSCFICHGLLCAKVSQAKDTLNVNETLDLYTSLESSNGLFRLDFIRREGSSPFNRYLGIQYRDIIDAVWVALPSVILSDSPVLVMEPDGQLVIRDEVSGGAFTINVEQPAIVRNTSATLLDNGNLVLRARSQTLWQSFDYPSNTWLPGMHLGLFNLNTQPQQRLLTSWITRGRPSPGAFTLGLDPNDTKQLVVMRRGIPYWHSGTWNGKNFSFISFSNNFNITFSDFSSESDHYFSWNDSNGYSFIQLSEMGEISIVSGDSAGANDTVAVCDIDVADGQNLSMGCITSQSPTCGGRDKFNETRGDIDIVMWNLFNLSLGPSDCKEICRRNCSCDVYTTAFSNGTGCKFSASDSFTYSENGETLYIRHNLGTKKDPGLSSRKHSRKWKVKLSIAVTVTMLLILTSNLLRRFVFVRDAKKPDLGAKMDDDQLLFFSLSQIKNATNNFSDANKLGQGGFGPVYKGKLLNGQEVAVKRLSAVSSHGIEQFKNEVILISKLQHKNLVRLLGYCIQREERLLVYEYLPNKSLDSFLFDGTKRDLLDWQMRVSVMQGIAQGLLYLHKYSRIKIIHRDLKTSNILLDRDMNPKISDFGTARIFQDNDSRGNTKRIMGTYGYMSPEYAIDGLFSEKTDVFSFGVMVLEIISGKKNTGFYHFNGHFNLLGYAWDLWTEGRVTELADPTLSETFCISLGCRYVQVALLCVEENAADRPTMVDVVPMLTNESVALPTPKRPAFYTIASVISDDFESPQPCSANHLTISEVEGR